MEKSSPDSQPQGDAMRNKPPQVRRAALAGDSEALSALGRAGARKAHEKRARGKELNEVTAEHRRDQLEAAAAVYPTILRSDPERAAFERRDDLLPEEE